MEELKIGRMLDQYGIPFFYKQPTVIMNQQDKQNEIYTPSFTLPQYACSIIDYLKDETHIPNRIQIYKYNHISATVLGPKDLENPTWQHQPYTQLQQPPRDNYLSLFRKA